MSNMPCLALDVLEVGDLVEGPDAPVDVHVGPQRVAVGRLDRLLLVYLLGLAYVLRRYAYPLLRETHHRARVHQTVPEFVRHFPLDSVQNPAVLVLERVRARSQNYEILHVAPRQVGVRFECQCGDACYGN